MALRTIIITAKRNKTLSTVVINRGPAGADGTGADNIAYGDLTDATTVDLPTVNTPLATALAALGGGGTLTYSSITDGTTVDLPTVNTPLSNALAGKAPTSHTHTVSQITDFPTLATVATSGSYADLTGTPSLVVNFGDLADSTTVDLPTVNTPLGTALSGKAPLSHTHTVSQITDFPTLANIATSGSWNDLSNVPTTFTPSAHTHVVADITDFPTLATVATSGAYSDLTGTPTIPSDSQVTEYLFDDGVHALTSTSGVVTPNALDGVSQKLTLSENISYFNPPTNLADGQSMLIQISNSAYTFDLDPSWEIISGTAQQVSNSTRSRLAITRFGNEYWISIESQ